LIGEEGERDEFGDSQRAASLDQLIGVITCTVEPSTWDEVGGPGSIEVCPHIDVLAIAQTDEVHDQIADLLGKIRRNLAQQQQPADAPQAEPATAATRLVVYVVPTPAPEPLQREREDKGTDKKTSRLPLGNARVLSQFGVHMGGGGMGGFGGGMGGMGGVPPAPIPESELLETIVELIEPRSWKERDDVYSRVLPGRLLIRHTDSVHRRIERLLHKLGVGFSLDTSWGMYGGGYF
jgi:hypothetical protein